MTERNAPALREEPGPTAEELLDLEEPTEEELAEAPPGDALGRFFQEAARVPLLTEEEVKALAKAKDAGDEEARQKLILSNLRLVIAVAKYYCWSELPMDDLIQEGCLGLMKAVEKYDHSLGYRFSTYAVWWIRQAITRVILTQGQAVRIPEYMVHTISRVFRTERELTVKLGRKPDEKEIAEALGMTVRKVREIRRYAQKPISLDSPGPPGEEGIPERRCDPERDRDPVILSEKAELKEQIRKALATLAPMEREILVLRYGLNDSEPRTLESLRIHFGCSKEWIRQTEKRALRKLKSPECMKLLRDFV